MRRPRRLVRKRVPAYAAEHAVVRANDVVMSERPVIATEH
jgi:hypothetical protein